MIVRLGAFLGSDMVKLGMAEWGMSQVRDGRTYFGKELEQLVDKTGLAVPAIRTLLASYKRRLG